MAYVATAEDSLPPMTAAPGVLALQRALVWLVGASGEIVFIEPSPYELVTLAATVIFLAMVLSEDTAARLDMISRGLTVGALIAATAGIAGYFNLVPGGHDLLTLYDRASGTFKDPNVLAITSSFMLALMVLTSRSRAQRSRIIMMTVVTAIIVAALIAVLLSFDSIAEMFT